MGMLGKAVLLYTHDRRGGRRVCASLRAAGSDVVLADDVATARQLIDTRAVDLVLFDHGSAGDLGALVDAAGSVVPLVVVASGAELSMLRHVLGELGVRHVIGRSGDGEGLTGADPREIVVTVEKILRGDVFGAAKYLPDFAVDLSRCEVRGAHDRDDLLETVAAHLTWLGAGTDVVRRMSLVVDELVTNAVYNAPRDEHGLPRYASIDRRQKVELDPWERAQVEFGSDGRWFVFSITDWFGALTEERIRDRICQGLTGDAIEHKAGGAGLGLYTVLRSVDQLVINLDPGHRTEVIAIVDLSRRGRARSRSHSLHIFSTRTEADLTASDATVVLSVDLRRELLASLTPAPAIVPLVRRKAGSRPPRARTSEPAVIHDRAVTAVN